MLYSTYGAETTALLSQESLDSTMKQSQVHPPVVIYGRRGYFFPYALYLHLTGAVLRKLVSYSTGAHDGFDKDLLISTPGLGDGRVKISICVPEKYGMERKPLVLVLEGGGFVLGQPKDGKVNDRRIAREVCF